jgi:hypothetical protein
MKKIVIEALKHNAKIVKSFLKKAAIVGVTPS